MPHRRNAQNHLDNRQLGGCNVEGIRIGSQPRESLLRAVRSTRMSASIQPQTRSSSSIPDKSVDLHTLNVVELLQRLLDLPLIRLGVHDEDQRVVLLDLLHRALRVQRVHDHLTGIEARLVRNRFSRIFGRTGESKGLGAVEAGGFALFPRLVRIDLYMRDRPSDDGSSDTPQGESGGLTPRRVDFAAALALAEGLPFAPPEKVLAACV